MSRQDSSDRFWSKVQKSEGCWIWVGAIMPKGYGQFWDGQRQELAHRYAYRIAFGPIPRGLVIRHECDNRRCVRPDHLIVGTYQDNSDDAVRRGRMKAGCQERERRIRERNHIKYLANWLVRLLQD